MTRIAVGAPKPASGRTITPSRSSASNSGRASSPTSAKRKLPTAGPAGSRPCARRIRSSSARALGVQRAGGARAPRASSRLASAASCAGVVTSNARRILPIAVTTRRGRDAVADAQPGEPVDLRERAQHDDAAPGLEVLLDRRPGSPGRRCTRSTPGRATVRTWSGTRSKYASSSARVFIVPVGLFGWQT